MTQPDQYGNTWDEAAQAYRGVGANAGQYYADGRWFASLGALNVYRSLVGGGDTAGANRYTQGVDYDGSITGVAGATYQRDTSDGSVTILSKPSTGGGSSVTVHNTPIQQQGGRYRTAVDDTGAITGIPGAVYQEDTFDGSISIVSKPAASASGDPRDKNNDGLVDSTGASIYVYQDASSPSGYWLDNADGTRVPTLRNGALFTGDSGREPSAGPTVNGVPYVWDPTSKKYVPAPGIPGAAGGIPEPPAGPSYKGVPYVWDSKKGEYVPAPGLHGIPDQGSGGDSDPLSSMVTAQINAQSRAASDAASARRASDSARSQAELQAARYGAESAEAEKARQFAREQQEKADAIQLFSMRLNYEIKKADSQQEYLKIQQAAAKDYAELVGSPDPGAFARYLERWGSMQAGMTAGDTALSTGALLPAGQALKVTETPFSYPSWESLAGGQFDPLNPPTIPPGGSAPGTTAPGGGLSGAPVVREEGDGGQAGPYKLPVGPVPAMQTNFDFTRYGGPKVDLTNMVQGTMTRLLGPGGGFVQDSAPPTAPAGPLQVAPTVLPGIAGGGATAGQPVPLAPAGTTGAPGHPPVPLANPYASMPAATRAALLAGGGLDPAVAAQLQALAPRAAQGGFTRAPFMVTGDAPLSQRPDANGARPEMILNPTGAPIQVVPAGQTQAMLRGMPEVGGMPRYATGTTSYMYGGRTYSPTQYAALPTRTQAVIAKLGNAITAPVPTTSTVATPISSPPPSTTVSSPPSTTTTAPATTAPATPTTNTQALATAPPVAVATPAPAAAPPPVATAPAPPAVPTAAVTPTPAAPAAGLTGAPVVASPTPSIPTALTPAPVAQPAPTLQSIEQTPNTAAAGISDDILQRVLAERLGAYLPPNVSYLDIGYGGLTPTLRDVYERGMQSRYNIPVQDIRNRAAYYRPQGFSRGAFAVGY